MNHKSRVSSPERWAWAIPGLCRFTWPFLHCHVNVVRELVKKHQDRVSLDLFQSSKQSPLHLATKSGRIDIARLLVDYRETLDILDRKQCTPQLLACYGDHESVAASLIQNEADVDIADEDNVPPLLAVVKSGNASTMMALNRSNPNW